MTSRAPPDSASGAAVSEKLPRLFLFSISLVSACALSYEVLLVRLLSIIHWHQFTSMVISLALLGYGASGTFLALFWKWLLPRFEAAFLTNVALFGLASVLCFLGAQALPFNALEILYSPREWAHLAALYLLLLPPFFFAANCTGLALLRFRGRVGRVYGADLLGAGAGSLVVLGMMFVTSPLQALAAVGALALFGCALAYLSLGGRSRAKALGLALAAPALYLTMASSGVALRMVDYKELPQTLRVMGATKVTERSSPLGLLTVVASPALPFRHVPGLSLLSPVEVPEQLAIFTDGEGLTAITRYDGQRDSLSFLDYTTSALPYHLLPEHPSVLVLGAGGGSEVLQALYHQAARIDAVELEPRLIDLVRHDFAEFSGRLFDHPTVRVHAAEARGFVAATHERYQLIQLALLDAFSASAAGLYALDASYLYTVEGVATYLEHLQPEGLLALTRWVRLPPRDEAKLFATAIDALKRRNVASPALQLAWVRGWQTSTLLVKNSPFTEDELALLKRFCDERLFDVAYYPGMQPSEANRHSVLPEPYDFLAATALLGPERESFVQRYKFDLRPATDDRPYFFHFFKPRLMREALDLKGAGGLALLDLGYPLLLATLLQAAVLSIVLILLPLVSRLRTERPAPGGLVKVATPPTAPHAARTGLVLVYFFTLGLAFLFTEMVCIQRFTLYLAHPLYAVPVVLGGFLFFAGLGSRSVERVGAAGAAGRVARAAASIGLLSALYTLLLPPLFEATMALPTWTKMLLVLALLAPLAFFMGTPYPLGLTKLQAMAEPLVPWAYGVNGCASVIAAVLASLLSIRFGHTAVLGFAVLLYVAAAWALSRWERAPARRERSEPSALPRAAARAAGHGRP